jgi:prepilin-type N-terminal cleavage/methylation domain-containing protein
VKPEFDRGGVFRGGAERRVRAGVTLVEMLIVLALMGLMTAISYPSVAAGVDRLRLRSAGDSLMSFFTGALNWAERRQQVVLIVIEPAQNRLSARSERPGYERRLEFPEGVRIASVQPSRWGEEDAARRVLVYPGGAPPAVSVTLANRRGAAETVRIDPVTGVAEAVSGREEP